MKTIISGSYSLSKISVIQSWAPEQFSIEYKSSEGAEIEASSPLFNHSMVLISYSL